MADQIWSWALTLVGATCFYLAGGLNGRKVWWAWYIGLFAQVLWATYALLDLEHRVGFLVGVVLYGYVYVRNCVNWTREHLAAKQAARKHAALVGRILEKLEGEKPGSTASTLIASGGGWITPIRCLDPDLLPLRRPKQCRFSWFSGMYGYVRCSQDEHYSTRHQTGDSRVWVNIGAELSAPEGSWDR